MWLGSGAMCSEKHLGTRRWAQISVQWLTFKESEFLSCITQNIFVPRKLLPPPPATCAAASRWGRTISARLPSTSSLRAKILYKSSISIKDSSVTHFISRFRIEACNIQVKRIAEGCKKKKKPSRALLQPSKITQQVDTKGVYCELNSIMVLSEQKQNFTFTVHLPAIEDLGIIKLQGKTAALGPKITPHQRGHSSVQWRHHDA